MQTVINQGGDYIQTFEVGLSSKVNEVILQVLDFDKGNDRKLATEIYSVLDVKVAKEFRDILTDAINNCERLG